MKPVDFSQDKMVIGRILKILNDHKDQLTIAPDLLVDELVKNLDFNNRILDVCYCPDEYMWDRYVLPYILHMTTKVFARC
jgi:hypothetical protein